jgi:hypothetical protein
VYVRQVANGTWPTVDCVLSKAGSSEVFSSTFYSYRLPTGSDDGCSCGWCQADDFGFCTELDGGWCLQVNAFAPSCSRNEPAAVEGPTAGLAHRLRSVRSSPSCSAVNCSACLSSHGCGWCEQAHSCLDLQSVYSSCSEPLIQNHSTCSRASGAAVSALLRNAAVVGLWLALFFSFHGVR